VATGHTDLAREMRLAARENLAAAILLLEHGYIRASASRFYFAMFQAVLCVLARRGEKPPGGRDRYWSHDLVERAAASIRGSKADALLFKRLRRLRTRADYHEARIPRADLELEKHDVRRFVEEVTA